MNPAELVCTVANVLVPGLGSVLNALVEIGKLCMEMKENRDMCVRVEKRFGDIFIQLQLMEKKGTLPKNDAVSRYSDLLEKFYLFLKKQHTKNVILRLAATKGVLVKIQDFHVDMDQLFKMLNLAHMDAMSSWQQQWEKDKLQQQQKLEILVGNTSQLLKELNTQKKQMEALTLLKFEVERSTDTEQSSDEVALLKSAFKKVVSVSKADVEKIPAWFLPPDDVDFDAEPFSRGSFGSVHRGIWGVGTDVVVKCLIDDASSNERAKESFLKECNVWYGMNHPHVIKMFGACHVTSPPFIVCEYADNGSLDNYLSRKSTTRATVWKMLYQTCLGLEYLHSRAIVHGDLKCNNVLVVGDSAKLADFGFSFIRVRASLMSMKPQTGATRWKAPELLTGDTPSLASDVYSFAMCIIEAVTGDAPWGMVDDDTVRHLVKEGQLPPHPKEMGDNEWQLVQQMCTKDPAQRTKLKIVAGLLNKIYHAEQEREIEAKVQRTGINEEQDVVKCAECQFVMGGGATFCSRCGYNIRDSTRNSRGSSNSGSSNSGSTASNPSAQVTPVDFQSRRSETEDLKKSQDRRLVCENCFAIVSSRESSCTECGEAMPSVVCESCFATSPAGTIACPECGDAVYSQNSESQSLKADGISGAISKERLLDIIDTVYTQMDQIMTTIRAESQKDPSMSADDRGPRLVDQFAAELETTQSMVYAAFHTTGSDVTSATDFYCEREDQDLINAVARLQELERVKTVGIVTEDEMPVDLTVELCSQIVRESMEKMNVAMEEECLKTKGLALGVHEAELEHLEEAFMSRVVAIAAANYTKYGFTRETLHAAIRKYFEDPDFNRLHTELKQHQQERFAAARALIGIY